MAGRVIGGHFKDAEVNTVVGSDLVVKSGLKWRKLNAENVAEWSEVITDAKAGGAFGAVGKAVAGAAIPGRLGKAASAAVGATFESIKPPRTVRVDWTDGKQSLIKFSDATFTHFAMMLEDRRTETDALPAAAALTTPAEPVEVAQSVTDQAMGLASGLLERLPIESVLKPNVAKQLKTLGALRDQGVLTDEEFAAKKAELLQKL